MALREDLIAGVEAALAGRWDEAHALAQKHEADPTGCWLHACLHKIEPDEQNSRYWYRRSGHAYEEYPDARAELAAIKAALTY
ncbi:MAG: hypothetical protein R3D44_04015 [Hyphomicrobiaceae bacterium]